MHLLFTMYDASHVASDQRYVADKYTWRLNVLTLVRAETLPPRRRSGLPKSEKRGDGACATAALLAISALAADGIGVCAGSHLRQMRL